MPRNEYITPSFIWAMRGWEPDAQHTDAEVFTVSIQVVGAGSRRTREEVIGRISGLVASIFAAGTYTGDNPDERAEHLQRAREETKAFFFSLLGSYPTGEEMVAMFGE